MLSLRAPVFHDKIAALASSNAEIMQHLDRLYVALQSTHGITDASIVPVTSKLDLVEGTLAPRVSALDEFINNPGATAHSVVEAFLAERASANIQPNAPPLTARSGVQTDQTLDSDGIEPDSSAVYRAIAQESFRRMAASVLAEDPNSRIGRLNAIAAGFDGQCVLGVRMLCEGNRALSLKHSALSRLFDLRAHLADYFTWCLLADSSGKIPSRMSNYSLVGRPPRSDDSQGIATAKAGQTFLTQLLAFELASMDWLNSPGGLVALKAVRDGGDASARNINAADAFTIPEIVNELGEFIHQLLVAMGAPKSGQGTGYSFAEWARFYVNHLLLAKKLRTRDLRLEHLDRCHEYFVTSLGHYGRELKSRVYCAQPDQKSIATPLFSDQDELIATMKEWESSHETALDMLHKFRGMFAPVSADAKGKQNEELDDPWVLPKRSQRQAPQKHPEAGTSKGGKQPEENPKRKRERERSANSGDGSASAAPGSTTWAHLWLSNRTELFISGRVWKIKKLAAKLKVKPGREVCWPVLYS